MELLEFSTNDIEEIKQLFVKTFSDSEGETEGVLIGNLTDDLVSGTDSEDLYGFVAVEENRIIGSIFFSRLRFQQDDNIFLLAPVAVLTGYQGQGIGQKLINYGLQKLKAKAVSLVITYGDPAFYSKVGFSQITEETIKPPLPLSLPHGWQAQSLTGDEIKPLDGSPSCVKAFDNPALW